MPCKQRTPHRCLARSRNPSRPNLHIIPPPPYINGRLQGVSARPISLSGCREDATAWSRSAVAVVRSQVSEAQTSRERPQARFPPWKVRVASRLYIRRRRNYRFWPGQLVPRRVQTRRESLAEGAGFRRDVPGCGGRCRPLPAAYPVYESSCSIFDRTQSKSPLVTLVPQCSHSPAMLTSSEAPQWGQLLSARGAPRTAEPRIRVQYSE